MKIIKVLSNNLANKIAAGEVVEKTMNVVKELVENAIDANANEITINLEESGLKLIEIIDNGKGMSKEDAKLAFTRHATSKIINERDLFNINSLGFRGEALPSIASVSKITLKTNNEEEQTEVILEDGNIINVNPTSTALGTKIIVSELFYNTPVRLKYLKNPYAELASTVDYVNKMALSYPHIRFKLTNNEKVLLNTDGSNNLLKVINNIYGLKITKKMVEINAENDDYEIKGYISYPEVMKSSRNVITILVNSRVINNYEIVKVIKEAYHTYLPKDKYPVVVLNIIVDPALIDVNIHPTKMDIKFSKLETLKELILNEISNKLNNLNLIVDASDSTEVIDNKLKVTTNYNVNLLKEQEEDTFEELQLSFEVNEEEQKYDPNINLKTMYPVGLVHGTYVISENEEGMYIIDQHAAHERINYEKYLKSMSNKERISTDLLIPIKIELTNHDYLIIKENLNILNNLGFIYEEFGINTIVFRSIPIWLPDQTEEAITKILEIIVSEEDFSLEKFVENVAITLACKMSIKANDHLTHNDMEILLERLLACENPYSCPHGRPTIITFTKYELERLFKRSA